LQTVSHDLINSFLANVELLGLIAQFPTINP
jgi:hypothetical protein